MCHQMGWSDLHFIACSRKNDGMVGYFVKSWTCYAQNMGDYPVSVIFTDIYLSLFHKSFRKFDLHEFEY